jgi:hypothetical protein
MVDEATKYFPTLPSGTAKIPAGLVEGSVTAATTAVAGTVKKAVAVADGAVPFASLTTAAQKVNELLAALRTAGVLTP